MICPCNSSLEYSNCCEIIHNDLSKAQTAESLMRARYSAFSLHLIDFLYNTFHPDTRRFQSKKEIENWAKENKWMQLEIIKYTTNTVEFKTHYLDRDLQTHIHHEKSNFKLFQNKWYYYDGILKN